MWFVWECYQVVHLLYPDDMGVVFNSIFVININKIWQRRKPGQAYGLLIWLKSAISHNTQITRNTPATISEQITVVYLLLGCFPIQ